MYSGFQTKHDSEIYAKCLFAMLTIMQSRLIALMPHNEDLILCDKFVEHFQKVYLKMVALDVKKESEVKFSLAVASMAKHVGLKYNAKDLSEEKKKHLKRNSSTQHFHHGKSLLDKQSSSSGEEESEEEEEYE